MALGGGADSFGKKKSISARGDAFDEDGSDLIGRRRASRFIYDLIESYRVFLLLLLPHHHHLLLLLLPVAVVVVVVLLLLLLSIHLLLAVLLSLRLPLPRFLLVTSFFFLLLFFSFSFISFSFFFFFFGDVVLRCRPVALRSDFLAIFICFLFFSFFSLSPPEIYGPTSLPFQYHRVYRVSATFIVYYLVLPGFT